MAGEGAPPASAEKVRLPAIGDAGVGGRDGETERAQEREGVGGADLRSRRERDRNGARGRGRAEPGRRTERDRDDAVGAAVPERQLRPETDAGAARDVEDDREGLARMAPSRR